MGNPCNNTILQGFPGQNLMKLVYLLTILLHQKAFPFCLACQEAQKAGFGIQFRVAPVAGIFVLLPGSRRGVKQPRHQVRNNRWELQEGRVQQNLKHFLMVNLPSPRMVAREERSLPGTI